MRLLLRPSTRAYRGLDFAFALHVSSGVGEFFNRVPYKIKSITLAV